MENFFGNYRRLLVAAGVLALLAPCRARGQMSIGNDGLFVKNGTTLAMDGLTLQPTADLELSDNEITRSVTAVPGQPPSVGRVYNFSAPVTFTGTVGISYRDEELNGNTESNLQIAYGTNGVYTVTVSGPVDETGNFVSNTLSGVSFNGLTAATPGALPVTLVAFQAVQEQKTIVLSWETTSELNSDFFEVQQSTNARQWVTTGRVQAAGYRDSPKRYSFTDSHPAEGVSYYRLKMTDRDASYAFSKIERVFFVAEGALTQVNVHPNPVMGELHVQWLGAGQAGHTDLLNSSGLRLATYNGTGPSAGISLKALPAGLYFIKVTSANGETGVARVVKP